ncbi:hypothetical protein M2480_003198 [Parabacteroides sp. PFB2-12]|uniref:PDDEXK-like family protein n=1 Tax=unclassified Parabacteroides TaxID=2649774 RepID=UPI002476FBFF|nr:MULTISPECIES: PD-(D/E)XK nuclease family protein [unclassified Parabacteroides]MDH6344291.1 hypothetical protein [Parabacteroides sp. PM6-13]MDH6392190.1 hypothetical protein [Parabacteroides sp. PFB2-12]
MENKIRNLLNQVDIINRKNAEILDATGGRFNIFRICGVNHYENTHSAIIAEFLNPKGSHGLGAKFLECFVKLLEIDDFDCTDAHVFTEYPTNNYVLDEEKGRIDILIESGGKSIILENKINAGDEWEQLKRYDTFAKRKYSEGNYYVYYLTLEGDEASKDSHCGVSYYSISYKAEIIDWLEKCVEIAVRFPIVRETIIQYINHLKQLTNQDMDAKNQSEIVEILMNNLDAAKTIRQNYEAIFDAMAEKYFFPEMEEFVNREGFKLEKRGASEADGGINFRVFVPEWKKCHISYSPEGKGYYYGIQYSCGDGKENLLSNETLEKLRSIFGYHFKWNDGCWPLSRKLEKIKWEEGSLRSFAKRCQEQILELVEATKDLEL